MLRVLCFHFSIAATLFFAFFTAQTTFASDPPNLISPPDNATEDKTPKLSWEYNGECIESGSCFRVEVDNNSDFSSPEKSTYSNSLSYSPRDLTDGVWYWRVRAKDKADKQSLPGEPGKWSDWSKVFKFNTGNVLSSPTASSAPSGSSKPQTDSAKPSNEFEVKDIPAEINSDREFEATIILKVDKPNTKFYLKGAFRKGDSLNYFGETYSGSEWTKNGSSYSGQLKIETNSEGKWEGKIKVRPDSQDSGFDGSGSYNFKIGRYTDSGNGPVWSNEISLKINEVKKPDPSPSEEPEEVIDVGEEIDITDSLVKEAPSREYEIKIASVAGEATMSNNISQEEQTRVLEERKINWLLIFLGVGVFIGGGVYTFLKIRKSKTS